MSGPYRLPETAPSRFGYAIDRAEPIGFRLGVGVQSGLYGDTLASALLASGVRIVGASPLLGRPRGVMALGLESDAFLAVEDGAGDWRSAPADAIPLKEGLRVRMQAAGLGRALRRFAPPAGPDRRALPAAQQLLERLRRAVPLPGPRLPAREAPPQTRVESCDVVVIGAGLAGLAAATRARAEGLEVLVVDAARRPGGVAGLYDGRIDGLPVCDWIERRAGELADSEALALGATAVAIEPDGVVTVIERASPQRPGGASLRLVSAGAVIVATGFRERPLVFPGNDRPGVMLAGAARALLRRHAVAPGAHVIVATLGDEGYRTAIDLREAGVSVELIVDARDDPQASVVDMAKALGAPLAFSSIVTGVEYDERRGVITDVRTQNRDGEGASVAARVRPADALIVSGGFAPRDELVRRSGLGPDQGVHLALRGPNAIDAVAGGWAAGAAAAEQLGRGRRDLPAPEVDIGPDEMGEPQSFTPASFTAIGSATAFVDFGADVTLADLARAVDRRGAAPEAVARRLGLGLGADCGRLCADLPGLALKALIGVEAFSGGPAAGRLTLGQMAARAELRD